MARVLYSLSLSLHFPSMNDLTKRRSAKAKKERQHFIIMSSSSSRTPPTTFVASSDVSSVVSSALAGLASFGPHQLHHRLEKNVVVSTPKKGRRLLQRRKQRVAVVSGGGSGHEPAMSGFTGPGFLSAAACGDVFASPSVDQIGHAIDAVLEEDEDIDSIALVVMNYTGGTYARRGPFFFSLRHTHQSHRHDTTTQRRCSRESFTSFLYVSPVFCLSFI